MNIIQEVKKQEDLLIQIRRHFHQFPELSGKEYETLEYIRNFLIQCEIPFVEVENGGILAEIDSGKPGKTVLLRADIDALPIQESNLNEGGKPKACISQKEGIQHACGHDAHTAMLMIAGKILNEHKEDFIGKILLCFERGEENNGNIFYLLQYFEANKVHYDTCFGIHIETVGDDLTGALRIDDGRFMAGMISFAITIKGKGGHGSRPDLSHSPIDCFCAIHQAISQIRMNTIPPFEPLTYSIGMVQSGTKSNIIPDELQFAGTIRYYDRDKAGKPFWDKMLSTMKQVASTHHCEIIVDEFSIPGYPVVNHPECAALARVAISKLFEDIVTEEPRLGTESFSFYQLYAPGVYVNLGTTNKEKGITALTHMATQEVDEDVLYKGVASHIAYSLEFLNNPVEIEFIPTTMSVKDILEDCGKTL